MNLLLLTVHAVTGKSFRLLLWLRGISGFWKVFAIPVAGVQVWRKLASPRNQSAGTLLVLTVLS